LTNYFLSLSSSCFSQSPIASVTANPTEPLRKNFCVAWVRNLRSKSSGIIAFMRPMFEPQYINVYVPKRLNLFASFILNRYLGTKIKEKPK